MSGKLLFLSLQWTFRHKLWLVLCVLSFSSIAILMGLGFSLKAGNEKQISSYADKLYISVYSSGGLFSMEEVSEIEAGISPTSTFLNSQGGVKICSVNNVEVGNLVGFNYICTAREIDSEFINVEKLLVSQLDFCDNSLRIFEVEIETRDGERKKLATTPTWRPEGDACIYWNVTWDTFVNRGYPISRVDFWFDTAEGKEGAVKFLKDAGYTVSGDPDELTRDEKVAKAVRYLSVALSMLLYLLTGMELYIIVSAIITENRSYLLVLKMLGIKKWDYNKLIMTMCLCLSLSGAVVGCGALSLFKAVLPTIIDSLTGELLIDFGGIFMITISDILLILAENIAVAVLCSLLLSVKEAVSFEKVK